MGFRRWASCSSQLCDVGVGWCWVGEILRWLEFKNPAKYLGGKGYFYKRPSNIWATAHWTKDKEFFISGLALTKRVAEEYHVTGTMTFVPSRSFKVLYLPAPCIYYCLWDQKARAFSPCLLQPRSSVCSDEKMGSPLPRLTKGETWPKIGWVAFWSRYYYTSKTACWIDAACLFIVYRYVLKPIYYNAKGF
jgi:hypothetical protein